MTMNTDVYLNVNRLRRFLRRERVNSQDIIACRCHVLAVFILVAFLMATRHFDHTRRLYGYCRCPGHDVCPHNAPAINNAREMQVMSAERKWEMICIRAKALLWSGISVVDMEYLNGSTHKRYFPPTAAAITWFTVRIGAINRSCRDSLVSFHS